MKATTENPPRSADSKAEVDRKSPEPPKGRFHILLICLLVLLFAYPYFEGFDKREGILGLGFSLVLISAVYVESGNRQHLVIALLLGVPALGSHWGRLMARETPILSQLLHVTALPFYLYVTVTMLVQVLRRKRITADTLCGAVSVYLLVGLTWAVAYAVLDAINPGSFQGNLITGEGGKPVWSNYLYYSYVTLTTLGYGDIVPTTSQTRSLALLESTTGILYIATLIARLVSMYETSRREARE